MNTPHGIGVTNRFELFLDDDLDPLEILQRQEEEKQKRKLEKTQVKEKGKPSKAAKSVVPVKKAPEIVPAKVTKPEELPNKQRGGKIAGRPTSDSNVAEKNTRNRDDHFGSSDQNRDGEARRGRGGFRGGRGGPRGRGFGFYPKDSSDNRPRRMFDRHSGSEKTGVKSTEKREGSGPNNWGDYSHIETWDEKPEEKPTESSNWGEEESFEAPKEDVPPKLDDIEGGDTKENDQTEEQIQDAVKEMTLDEYKKEQEAKRTVPKYNIRKPGEGEDDNQWKKSYMLKKKIVKEDDDEEDEEEEDEEFGRQGQKKVLLDIKFNFSDARRGSRGRGRGGRGAPRGGGGMGPVRDSPREEMKPRGGPPKSSKQAAPRVDDFNDFPSLAN